MDGKIYARKVSEQETHLLFYDANGYEDTPEATVIVKLHHQQDSPYGCYITTTARFSNGASASIYASPASVDGSSLEIKTDHYSFDVYVEATLEEAQNRTVFTIYLTERERSLDDWEIQVVQVAHEGGHCATEIVWR